MKKLCARQLYFFLAFLAPVGKIILLPANLVRYAQNDLLFPLLFHLLLQAGVVFLLVWLGKGERTVFELVENALGRAGRVVFSVIFGLFLLYACIFPLVEQKSLVQSVFYDTLPSFITFLPYFLLCAYLCSQPFFKIFRTWDILAPLTMVGFLGLFVLSVGSADFGALLPVGASGWKRIAQGTAYSFPWFYDTALLLTFVGQFKYEKGMALKSSLFYLLGGLIVLFFFALFYGIFSDISMRQSFAFAKISKYFSATAVLGRIDYIFIILLALTMAFYLALPIHASCHCFTQGIGWKVPPVIPALSVNVGLIVLIVSLNFSPHALLTWISEKLFFLFPVFTVGVPCACLLLRRTSRER